MMQALFYLGNGNLAWRETAAAECQGPGEALVRPQAVAACDLDVGIVAGTSPFEPPFVLGHEFAGEVVAVGERVGRFRPGDKVAVSFQPSCGECRPCRRAFTAACAGVPHTAMYGIGAAGGEWGGALADLVRVPYADVMLQPLPEGVTAAMAAGASDNMADGYRTVAGGLQRNPGASVLVAGSGAIALYAVYWAGVLGAGRITLCSRDRALLRRAEALGADALMVEQWPRRFATHAVTVDCTGEPAGLAAVLRSTEAFGECTSAAIYFSGDVAMPLLDLYMKGIRFVTGRVNGAALLPELLSLIARHALTPEAVDATLVDWAEMPHALQSRHFRPIARRD